MSIKILGGIAKGTTLSLPDEEITRPTLVLLKRRIFDAIQNLEGRVFVDACAGSGAIGLEAWSRGSKKVYLIEPDKKVFICLTKNVDKFRERFSSEIKERDLKVIPSSFEKFLSRFIADYSNWDEEDKNGCILFFDPPYSSHDFYKKIILEELKKNSWYKGSIWVESDEKKGIPFSFWKDKPIEITKSYAHGHSYIFVAKF
jgi:16S rRNA (guanine966-N2)-methyltransferase